MEVATSSKAVNGSVTFNNTSVWRPNTSSNFCGTGPSKFCRWLWSAQSYSQRYNTSLLSICLHVKAIHKCCLLQHTSSETWCLPALGWTQTQHCRHGNLHHRIRQLPVQHRRTGSQLGTECYCYCQGQKIVRRMIQCAQTIQCLGLRCCLVVDPPVRSADDHYLRCLVVDIPLGSADDHHQLKYKLIVFFCNICWTVP